MSSNSVKKTMRLCRVYIFVFPVFGSRHVVFCLLDPRHPNDMHRPKCSTMTFCREAAMIQSMAKSYSACLRSAAASTPNLRGAVVLSLYFPPPCPPFPRPISPLSSPSLSLSLSLSLPVSLACRGRSDLESGVQLCKGRCMLWGFSGFLKTGGLLFRVIKGLGFRVYRPLSFKRA